MLSTESAPPPEGQAATQRSRLRKTIVAAFAFIVLEVWVFMLAAASPSDPSNLGWETFLSAFLFGYGAFQGVRLLGQARRGRVVLALLAVFSGVLGFLAVVPLRDLDQGTHFVKVHKAARTLELFRGTELVGKYRIGLGGSPLGDKAAEGDLRTPEGDFYVTDKAPSQFHKWLGLSYPDSRSAWRGRLRGKLTWAELWYLRVMDVNNRIPYSQTALGGDVGIHGGGSKRDWTLGCIALENEDVDTLYEVMTPGSRVQVLP